MTVIVGILEKREGLLKVIRQKGYILTKMSRYLEVWSLLHVYSMSIQQCSMVGLRSSDLDAD